MGKSKKALYDLGDNPPVASIRFLTQSQECNYVEYLAYLGLDDPESCIHKRLFNEDDIIGKLFIDINGPLFLKNKYLYLFGEGASNYLFARQSMTYEKKELDILEMSVLDETLIENYSTSDHIILVAVGSANAIKEINALKTLKNIRPNQRFKLIPIDVGMLMLFKAPSVEKVSPANVIDPISILNCWVGSVS